MSDNKQDLSEESIFSDPSTSYWLRQQIKDSEERDILDALKDAELLAAILQKRFDHMMSQNNS